MRGALSLFLLCIALSQAIVYETSFDVIPTTGYFSPIYRADPPALFNIQYSGGFDPSVFIKNFCDGKLVDGLTPPCTTYQIVFGTTGVEPVETPIVLTVFQTDIVNVTLGQNYTSENPTSYQFSSDVPYLYSYSTFDSPLILYSVDFSNKIFVPDNVTLVTTSSDYPLHASTYPKTFGILQADGFSFVYEGVTYDTEPVVCSSQDAVVLVDESQSNGYNFLPARSCKDFASMTGAYNATVISTQTPASLNVSTSDSYTVPCQTYGNSTANYALVKLVNTDVYSKGGVIDGLKVTSQPGTFDIAYNCGAESSISLSIQVNGPYTPVNISAKVESTSYSDGFYQINVPAGIISDAFSSDLLKRLGVQTCSTEMSVNYFGGINSAIFDVCFTVNDSVSVDVPALYSSFVIQPPEGYCIRGDGIPSDPSTSDVYLLSQNSASFFYEDMNTALFTVTCSDDILTVQLDELKPMTLNFTLIPIRGQGKYGQTYDVDGLLAIQYPPLKAPVGILAANVTGSAYSLLPVVNVNMLGGKRTVTNNLLTGSNSLQTNTSPLTQFVVLAGGQGQLTVNVGTVDGVNVDYDTTSSTSSSSSTSSTSSTESSSSTSSEESTSSTSSTSSEELTSSTSSEDFTSSTSSEEFTSSESTSSTSSTFDSSVSSTTPETSYEESTSAGESFTDSPSTSTITSTSPVQSTSSTTSVQSTGSTTSVQSTTSSTSSTSAVVTSLESEENGTDSSATTKTSASMSVSFTDTSVSPTENVASDSSMVKASILSVVVMALFCLC